MHHATSNWVVCEHTHWASLLFFFFVSRGSIVHRRRCSVRPPSAVTYCLAALLLVRYVFLCVSECECECVQCDGMKCKSSSERETANMAYWWDAQGLQECNTANNVRTYDFRQGKKDRESTTKISTHFYKTHVKNAATVTRGKHYFLASRYCRFIQPIQCVCVCVVCVSDRENREWLLVLWKGSDCLRKEPLWYHTNARMLEKWCAMHTCKYM